MTKRASGAFARKASDYYPTPAEAVTPLLPHLRRMHIKYFVEPCCGEGELIGHLEKEGLVCVFRGDLNYEIPRDARDWVKQEFAGVDATITNPPWEKSAMHGIMQHLCVFKPAWFLIYSDWLFTKQSGHIMRQFCTDIVPIGRVRWIPGSKNVGFDNCAWVRLDSGKKHPTLFWPMAAKS